MYKNNNFLQLNSHMSGVFCAALPFDPCVLSVHAHACRSATHRDIFYGDSLLHPLGGKCGFIFSRTLKRRLVKHPSHKFCK